MKNGRKSTKASTPTDSNSSSAHRGTPNTLAEARGQDGASQGGGGAAPGLTPARRAQISPHGQVLLRSPALLLDRTIEDNIHSALAENAHDERQHTPIGLSEPAFDFRISASTSPAGLGGVQQLGSLGYNDSIILPSPRDTHVIVRGMQTLSALVANASILHIRCGPPYELGVRISSSSQTPATLSPTELQSCVPHFPYIDLIPFPSMRDQLLKSSQSIDRDEIWLDLAMGGFSVWGNTPWDKRGWEVHAEFATKWWWLMTDEVLDESNFWRLQRGEEKLTVGPAKKRFEFSEESINFLKRCIIR